ncbi:MAG TPA: hypothetical protein VGQ83_25100 [Polyangia bacterium]|jgi:hypothetical protein
MAEHVAASEDTHRRPGGSLLLTASPVDPSPDVVAIVLDPTWTPDPAVAAAGRVAPIRDSVDATLRDVDPIALTSTLLEGWAAAAGIVETLKIGGTSFWYYVRLRHSIWLQERVIWAHVLRRLVDAHRPAVIVVGDESDPAIVDVARLIAATDGIRLDLPEPPPVVEAPVPEPVVAPPVVVARKPKRSVASRARRFVGRMLGRKPPPPPVPTGPPRRPPLAPILAKVAALESEPGRLLVVSTHDPHLVETPSGPRLMNPFLGPIADVLRGTRLEPITVDWRAKRADPVAFARTTGPGTERILPLDAFLVADESDDPAVLEVAEGAARSIRDVREAIPVAGIDLGQLLAEVVSEDAVRWFPSMQRTVPRITRLVRHLRPAGILIADEYHREDWREAAAATGTPFFAVQHGTISRHHQGYIHATRPPALRLPDRTFVFGRWEHDRLVRDSVYREDEVVVGGSPRLDYFRPTGTDREAVRRELGVAPGDRLVVLSGTWGTLYRRFHYPVVLARLFDRPLPGIHVVVKQHPGERDEGPYRPVIEGVAAARGFAPPPITVVRDTDLYRLLGAADAHLGIHSTVLTEAVFVGTPNLLATGILGGDLLDYVEAGVALPVETGADLLAALDASAGGALRHESRTAFIERQYEPGSASERIAADLLEWLPPAPEPVAAAPAPVVAR